MNLQERIVAMSRVGSEIEKIIAGHPDMESGKKLAAMAKGFQPYNAWFSEKMILHRLGIMAKGLKKDILEKWLSRYDIKEHSPKTIAVILAGNIPLAGADDLLAVLIHGDRFLGKLSSDDKRLFPAYCELICEAEPRFKEQIAFSEAKLTGMDAVIATGSNNSGKYFDFYFAKYPHIIRRNRNGVAVLNGSESDEELKKLSDDIFLYFGTGCRSVSKLFVPVGYKFDHFFGQLFHWWDDMNVSTRYMNNYEYNRTVYLLNDQKLLDNNFLLLKEDIGLASPPGVLYYEFYSSPEELQRKLRTDKELFQCIVSNDPSIAGSIPFGTAQETSPWDYSDNVDTVKFLQHLVN